ncbi:LOW QUALITY PROTEIN: hypothetical protein CVT26_011601 [Gymnopilus dilepis]|uniref:Peptidase A1 domain-containing protein n=1 Tax=Gymnopilus dilepis TaxID=231916 RepID=A0A409YQQ4_9AGAR|nr:LOW QUALITY PROTEIN: hypothetical protein CVT26_011601 [Gymnopilus dilepis]
MFPTALLTTLLLALSVAANPVLVSRSPVSLPLSRRLNLTSAHNLVRHDQNRAQALKLKGAARAAGKPIAERSIIDTQVDNQAVTYLASVQVGSPATTFDLLVDTGSSNTWVGAGTRFRSTSTTKSTGQRVAVTYGSGSFSGTEFIDQVVIGPGLTINSQSIGVASRSTGFAGVDGIIGIGPVDLTIDTLSPDTSSTIPTVTDNLFSQGTISAHEIGILFAPSITGNDLNGVITWGGVDNTLFTGSITFIPVTSTAPSSEFWGIDQTITYGSTTILSQTAGIVDTGTTLVLLASDGFAAYQKATGGVNDRNTGLLKITSAQFSNLQPLVFKTGGATFSLSPNAQLWPRALNTDIGGVANAIYLIVNNLGTPSGEGFDFVNGFAFLERFYSVFDTANNQLYWPPSFSYFLSLLTLCWSPVSLPLSRRLNLTSVHNLVRHDQNRARALKLKGAARAAGSPLAERAVIDEQVDNQAVTYIASVQVGSPATTFELLVDTGSSNTWVGAGTKFKSTSTTKSTGQKVAVTYGSGSFSGTEFIDQVTIAGGLTISQQSIGVASTSEGFEGVDGIIGIGPVDLTLDTLSPATTSTIPTVVDNLFAQGTISSREIGILFAPSITGNDLNGVISWGGPDSAEFTGSITFLPVTKTSPASEFWGIDQTITYAGTTILAETAGIVDTGTTLILLASNGFAAYQKATGAVLDRNTGLLKITSAQFSSLQPLTFTAPGANPCGLVPDAQAWPRALNTDIGGVAGAIYLIVNDLGTPSGEGFDFVNGFAFLERFYSVFDTANNRVGFAETQFTVMLAATILATLYLIICVAANPVLVNRAPVVLPLARRLNFTSVHNLVRHDQNRAKALKLKGAAKAAGQPDSQAAVTSSQVDNQAVTYVASVGVGNPATQYDLIVDTGSSNTWVGAGKAFARTSTTSSTINLVSVTYGSGSFSGREVTDQVSIAPGLTISKQSIGVADESEGFEGVDGIIGSSSHQRNSLNAFSIGPVDLTEGTLIPSIFSTIPTVTDNLFSQGTIPAHEIGISFQPSITGNDLNGEITWGGTDATKFIGSITFIPITSTSPANEFWGIDESISYAGQTILSTTAGIVDTGAKATLKFRAPTRNPIGTTLVLLATDGFDAYQAATGAVLDQTTGLLTLTAAQFSNLQNLDFTTGGATFSLTPNAQLWPRALNTDIGGIAGNIYLIVNDLGTPSGEGLDFINGFAFLERFYSVFDTAGKQVGFAPTLFTDATMFSSAFLATLLLSLSVAASPVVVNKSPVSLPLSRRLNLTSVHNLVRHDQNRAKALKSRGNSKPVGARRSEDAVIDSSVDNQAVTYVASVGVGNPPTQYNLIVDTGSSNTWVGAGKAYGPTSSRSGPVDVVSVTYGSGSVIGFEWIDEVTIAPSLVIPNQSIGGALLDGGFSGYDGILGLGPVDLTEGTLLLSPTSTIPTVTDNFFSRGSIPADEIGISFEPSITGNDLNGEITWGGTDAAKFTGTITYIPITSTSPAKDYWGIDQSITYAGQTILSTTAGVVDTGTTLILIASNGFAAYQAATGAVLDPTTQLLKITAAQFGNLQNLNFNAGGTTFALTPNAQIWPRSLNTDIGGTAGSIYLIVNNLGTPSGGGLDFINGFAFLERFYSVYDTANKRVGLATTPFTTATTN